MGLFGGNTSREDVLRLEARVTALEATVAGLVAGQPVGGGAAVVGEQTWAEEARALKAGGRALRAVKLVRDRTGWGLKEAKDYVDRL